MTTYLLHFYDLETGEYLFSKEPQKTPNGEPILDVLGATHIPPPKLKEKTAAQWTGKQWILVEDNRGVAFWLEGDTYFDNPRYMKTLGKLPKNASTVRPDEEKTEELYKLQERMDDLEYQATRYAHEIELARLQGGKAHQSDIDTFINLRKEITRLREEYRLKNLTS